MVLWVVGQFLLSSIVVVFAAIQLAKYGDVIALRTRLGRMFIGLLLIAGATSLPEVLTTISAIFQGVPNLAAGNLLGSNMFNMVMLAVLDVIHYKRRLLRRAALKHALSGSLTMFIIALAIFFIVADLPLKIGWVGVDSLAILLTYVFSMRLIQANSLTSAAPADPEELPPGLPSLRTAVLGFLGATVGLIIVTPLLVSSSTHIAEITGLGTTFIGTTLVALVTSLPEVVTTLAAVRIGADDMAIGNLYGSNMFNMAALGFTDLFALQGRFLGIIDPSFLLIGMLGLLMTGMGLIGNLARLERRIFIVEMDALAIFLVYIGGIWLLFSRGLMP
jgi:cation:H+ antiporter